MDSEFRKDIHGLDEGSWAYVSLWGCEKSVDSELHSRVSEACELSGWPAVSRSSATHLRSGLDSARFFEGMDHAVEHSDIVIVLIDSSSAMTDAELAFAYKHKRPVIGLRFGGALTGGSEIQAMLEDYSRARLIDCVDVDDCAVGLRRTLEAPEFAAMVREAASEAPSHA